MDTFLTELIKVAVLMESGNQAIIDFLNVSSSVLEIAAIIGVIGLIFMNEPIRKRKRPQDKLIFWECILVICSNTLNQFLKIGLYFLFAHNTMVTPYYIYYVFYALDEAIYMMILLQWLICVDYSLHHSVDHIRRRYQHALLPIVIVTILDITQSLVYLHSDESMLNSMVWTALHIGKFAVEVSYIGTAIFLVMRSEKERREPRFLRLTAFIIPFLLGVIFRYYDSGLIGFGVIFTYSAMKRRDLYIDIETDLYNPEYLDCISSFWDKKNFKDSSALIVAAPGNGDILPGILKDLKVPDCFIIKLNENSFVMLTKAVRSSALKMTGMLLTEQAGQSEKPFVPLTKSLQRKAGQSAVEFAADIRDAASKLAPSGKGGDRL